jgi:hypothetical protein
MHVLPRRIGAVLVGALVVTALALTMTARADAATTKVQIVSKVKIGGLERVMSPRATQTKTATSTNDLTTFIKEDVGQAARYRWSFAPDMCLTGTLSSPAIFVETCDFGNDQLWTQGFSGGLFREFRNVKTQRSATAATAIPRLVTQVFFSGADNQLWQVRAV